MRFITRILTPLAFLLAMLLPAGAAIADPAVIFRGGETTTEVNGCNGESIVVNARFQFVTITQKNGETINRLSYHSTGIGDQGNEYVLNVTELIKDGELVQRREMISQGSAPNEQILIILPATGGIIIESDCRG